MTRGTYLRLLGVMIVLTIVSSVVMLIPDWNGPQGSAEADDIDTLLDVMIVLSCFVFSVVVVMLGYCLIKFRAKPGDESDGKPVHGNTRLEIAWTVIPTVIVLFGAAYSWIVLDDLETEAADQLPIRVEAQQFEWSFEYPEEGITTTEMHVPVNQQLELDLVALDVLHSFWVPEWGIKRDLVPEGAGGDEVDDTFVVTPNEEGTYTLVCTELCGLGHATMRAPVVVESQDEFDKWVSDQTAAAAPAGGSGSSGGAPAAGASGT